MNEMRGRGAITDRFVADSLWILLVLASAELVLEPANFSPACARVSVANEGPTRSTGVRASPPVVRLSQQLSSADSSALKR